MIIANYPEYVYAIRELFYAPVWDKANKYVYEAEENRFKDNKERIALQSAIFIRNQPPTSSDCFQGIFLFF